MTLTNKSMRTDPAGNVWDFVALWEDIADMDSSQLERYVRLASQGQTDPKFLPQYSLFWHAFSTHGGGDRSTPTPGRFFAGLYTTLPSIVAKTFTRDDGSPINVDPEYRTRLEKILIGILNECLTHDGQPTNRELMLGQAAIDAISHIRFSDGNNSPERQMYKMIKEKEPLPVTEFQKLSQKVEFPDRNKNELYQLAAKLKEDTRYSSIDFEFV